MLTKDRRESGLRGLNSLNCGSIVLISRGTISRRISLVLFRMHSGKYMVTYRPTRRVDGTINGKINVGKEIN